MLRKQRIQDVEHAKAKALESSTEFVDQLLQSYRDSTVPRLHAYLVLMAVASALLLCNASYQTRDSLLLFFACSVAFALATRHPDVLAAETPIALFVRSIGVSSALLREIGSTPAVLSARSGQWTLLDKDYRTWVRSAKEREARPSELLSSVVSLRVLRGTDPEAARAQLLVAAAFLPATGGAATLLESLGGVMVAMWRKKYHAPFAVDAFLKHLGALHTADTKTLPSRVVEAIQHRRLQMSEKQSREDLHHTHLHEVFEERLPALQKVELETLGLELRVLLAPLFMALSLPNFHLTGLLAQGSAMLADVSLRLRLSTLSTLSKLLRSMGFDAALCGVASRLLTHESWRCWSAGEEFAHRNQQLRQTLEELSSRPRTVKLAQDLPRGTARSLEDVEEKLERTPRLNPHVTSDVERALGLDAEAKRLLQQHPASAGATVLSVLRDHFNVETAQEVADAVLADRSLAELLERTLLRTERPRPAHVPEREWLLDALLGTKRVGGSDETLLRIAASVVDGLHKSDKDVGAAKRVPSLTENELRLYETEEQREAARELLLLRELFATEGSRRSGPSPR